MTAALGVLAAGPSFAAAAAKFEAANYVATISGEQTETQTLTLEGEVKVKCPTATYAGELAGPAATLNVTPTFSSCTAFGVAATVVMNGCQLSFAGNSEVGKNEFSGSTGIACPTGKSIVVTAANCEAKVGSQSGVSSTTYTSNLAATPPNVKVKQNLSGIKYTVTKDGSLCPFAGTGEKTNGGLVGSSVLKASHGFEAVGLAVATAAPTRLCEEAPMGNCPVGKTFKVGLAISGLQQKLPLLTIVEKGATTNIVSCEFSTFGAKTEKEVANPLPLEALTVTFTACQDTKAIGCAEPNVTTTTGTLDASMLLKEGDGLLAFPITIELDCGAAIEQCVYATAATEFWLIGGGPATISSQGVPIKNTAGKKGCGDELQWFGSYEVTAPKAVWVSP